MKRKFLTLATAGLMASAALLAPASPAYAADTWCGTARDYKVTGTTKTSAKAEGRTLALRTYNSHVFAVIYGGASGDAVSMGWNYSGNDVSYWCGGYGGSWPLWSTVPDGKNSAFTAAVPFSQVNWAFARGKLAVTGFKFDTVKVSL
ncbi:MULTISPECIES: hypothetical protein [Micromonospora]|uniref:hypothetical protein n=1 Tax=Micromonospora TaxID=1873 RepID=UPI00098D3569|nr:MULTISPECIES: hypothetical protein [unclassified Micromonospora]MDI5940420.1 hypothetical protein [Micromonospora sp. DH15]OON28495.1 hypothetical protein BSA16_26475 [Micromonospora sp. Rc5]